MQQIERYGVIALVFFLITIVAVSFWGDSKSPGFWSRLTGRGKKDATADHILPPPSSTDTALNPTAPLDTDKGRIVPLDGSATTAGTSVAQPKDVQANGLVSKPGDRIATTLPGGTSSGPASLTPSAPPSATPAPAAHEYVVQKGDSLALIARHSLGKESRWPEIAALNPGLTPKSLKVGAKIALPADSVASGETPAPTLPTAAKKPASAPKEKAAPLDEPASKKVASAGGYKVQKGDTLKSIARRELGDEGRWKDIVAANPGLSPSKLSVGQSLHLPAGAHDTEVASLVPAEISSKPHVR